MSAHQLTQYYQQQLVPFYGLNYFDHVIYASETSTYHNIAKLLTHPCILPLKIPLTLFALKEKNFFHNIEIVSSSIIKKKSHNETKTRIFSFFGWGANKFIGELAEKKCLCIITKFKAEKMLSKSVTFKLSRLRWYFSHPFLWIHQRYGQSILLNILFFINISYCYLLIVRLYLSIYAITHRLLSVIFTE